MREDDSGFSYLEKGLASQSSCFGDCAVGFPGRLSGGIVGSKQRGNELVSSSRRGKSIADWQGPQYAVRNYFYAVEMSYAVVTNR